MKIGIDARMFGPKQTGIGVYIKHIVENLPAQDPDNEYVVFLLEPYYSDWEPPSKNITKVKTNAYWYSYAEQTTFLLQLLKHKLDLCHFPNFNVPVLYRKKHIVTIHDITPRFFHGHRMTSPIRRKGFDMVFTSAMKNADKIIAVSEFTKQSIIKHYHVPEDRIDVTYEGYDSRFHVIENHDIINALKRKFSITKPFIFYVGVWRNHKNLVGLVKAFDILLKQYKMDIQLVLGGKEFPQYPEVRQTWEQLGLEQDIIRPGFISDEDVPIFYNAADVYVVPSFSEGFGFNGLEAMACGTPVASSNATCLPEVYENAAEFFDPQDPQDMARAIHSVLTNEQRRSELITNGFNQIKKYSWEQCAQDTLRIYRSVLKI